MACEPLNIFFVLVKSFYFWGIIAIIGWVAFRRWDNHRLHIPDFDYPLPNRYYTTAFRYYFAGVFYALIIISIYVLITVVLSIDQIVEFLLSIFGNVIGVESFNLKEQGLCIDGRLYEAQKMLQAEAAINRAGEVAGAASAVGSDARKLVSLEDRVRGVLLLSFTILVVLSSSPYVGPFDIRLRDRFHRFAAVPAQARKLANQIVAGIPVSDQIVTQYGFLPDGYIDNRWSDPRVFAAINDVINRLLEEWGNDYPKYREFFSETRSNLDQLEDQLNLLNTNLEISDRSKRYYNAEMEKIVDRIALLLACGALKNESDEHRVALFLREVGITTIDVPRYRFSLGQVVLGLPLLIALSMLVQGGIAAGVHLLGYGVGPETLWPTARTGLAVGAGWAIVTTCYFLVPVILAAGIQLYFDDQRTGWRVRGRKAERREVPGSFVSRLGYIATIFVLSYISAFITLLLFIANVPEFLGPSGNAPPFEMVAPWPLTAALFGVSYSIVASMNLPRSTLLCSVVDFLFIGIIAGAAAFFIASFTFAIDAFGSMPGRDAGVPVIARVFEGQLNPQGQRLWSTAGFALANGIIAGVLGAAMANLSRRRVRAIEDDLGHFAPDPDDTNGLQPVEAAPPGDESVEGVVPRGARFVE